MGEHFKKEAKRLVKHAIQRAGGQHAVSGLTGVDTSQLSRWGNEDDDERHITLYRAMEIDEAADDAILKGWARRRGAELVFRDRADESAENFHKLAAHAAKAHGDFVSMAHEAAADGVCTNLEERELSAKKHSHDEASDKLFAAVTRMNAGH
ncbi:DNA-binding transcriptional regulator YdaS (Cro superfamily) [Bradyrhizobium sp. USDA 4524]|uniref:phage regulatory CII family protein n=1 Tax=unclassified Bradyrhizobium TaxID=2631580 RepID=UPI00209FBCD6|nr:MULTISPECIES: phage regulatory CII family protein [unclassified Bradyrhizobium]MCP1844419.1 DNA-binding transcriptional regulator YdaS (Cro superfamily) [Bradyrhizobium sp. USDA 4538]MCP1904985.1 DNA-binding transcriptional regulator YdaS (Cro superfamily) [Bradyrhizobium sp. USDA 4537]MCP1989359.1 DNA-binding transcriptional regulator YdaS (Cro superfamily) [Bradyrhizobium sp. USDA 4539]